MRNVNDPAAFAHHMVEADGLAIHYVDEGVGPLVILLHGFPYTWFEWRHQIAALTQAGFRVVAPDIRGFGQSGKPDRIEDYTILHSASDVVALLAALGEDRAVLVGHDLGAWVAAAAARMRPDLFPALALVSTVVGPREPQRPSAGWAKLAEQTGGRFCHHYFQQPGLAEAQIDADVARRCRELSERGRGIGRDQRLIACAIDRQSLTRGGARLSFERTPGSLAGRLSVLDRDLAIDDHGDHACAEPCRVGIVRAGSEADRVEHHDIG